MPLLLKQFEVWRTCAAQKNQSEGKPEQLLELVLLQQQPDSNSYNFIDRSLSI
jgi:hypothetical protein